MKKFVLAAVAASMVAAPTVASAAPQRTVVKERGNKTVVVQRGGGVKKRTVINNRRGNVVRQQVRVNRPTYSYRNWQRGQRFNRSFAPNYRVIDYRGYRNRGVYAPPRGHQWVQSGNDAVLVSLASGLIGAVIGGAIFN